MTLHRQPDDPGVEESDLPEGMGLFGLALVLGLLHVAVVVMALVWMTWTASAHEAPMGWLYDGACCSDRDCAELPKGAVKEGPEGYEVTILPGQHPMVKDEVFRATVPYTSTKVRQSPDGLYHGCVLPSGFLICLYVGSRGV